MTIHNKLCKTHPCQYLAHAALRYRIASKEIIRGFDVEGGTRSFFALLDGNGKRWAEELELATGANLPRFAIHALTKSFEQQVFLKIGPLDIYRLLKSFDCIINPSPHPFFLILDFGFYSGRGGGRGRWAVGPPVSRSLHPARVHHLGPARVAHGLPSAQHAHLHELADPIAGQRGQGRG